MPALLESPTYLSSINLFFLTFSGSQLSLELSLMTGSLSIPKKNGFMIRSNRELIPINEDDASRQYATDDYHCRSKSEWKNEFNTFLASRGRQLKLVGFRSDICLPESINRAFIGRFFLKFSSDSGITNKIPDSLDWLSPTKIGFCPFR